MDEENLAVLFVFTVFCMLWECWEPYAEVSILHGWLWLVSLHSTIHATFLMSQRTTEMIISDRAAQRRSETGVVHWEIQHSHSAHHAKSPPRKQRMNCGRNKKGRIRLHKTKHIYNGTCKDLARFCAEFPRGCTSSLVSGWTLEGSIWDVSSSIQTMHVSTTQGHRLATREHLEISPSFSLAALVWFIAVYSRLTYSTSLLNHGFRVSSKLSQLSLVTSLGDHGIFRHHINLSVKSSLNDLLCSLLNYVILLFLKTWHKANLHYCAPN